MPIYLEWLWQTISLGTYTLTKLSRKRLNDSIARVSTLDLVRLYTCCIRSVCDYAVPVLYSSLPNYLITDLERVQKRALSIICPHLSYNESLAFLDMDWFFDHHSFLCSSLFSKVLDDKEHELHHLLPQDIPLSTILGKAKCLILVIKLIAQRIVLLIFSVI